MIERICQWCGENVPQDSQLMNDGGGFYIFKDKAGRVHCYSSHKNGEQNGEHQEEQKAEQPEGSGAEGAVGEADRQDYAEGVTPSLSAPEGERQ
jgi:hypothetical protein